MRFKAFEAPGGQPNGTFRTYTTTVTIDTTPPPPVQNLLFEPGRRAQGNDPGETDVLSWDAVTDSSPGGFRYLVYQSSEPISAVTDLTPRVVLSDTTQLAFPPTSSARSFAVVTEDAAGNRSFQGIGGTPDPAGPPGGGNPTLPSFRLLS